MLSYIPLGTSRDGTPVTTVILFAHGSPVPEANQGIAALARRVQESMPGGVVLPAFLDSAQPDLGAAVAEAVRRGASRLVVMPYFLTVGLHCGGTCRG